MLTSTKKYSRSKTWGGTLKKFMLRISVIFWLLFALPAGTAFAEVGWVKSVTPGCEFFVVETTVGQFAVLQLYIGILPHEGDVIAGDYESYGFAEILNVTANQRLKVWVEGYWVSEKHADEKYEDKCGQIR